jgi:carbon-monoxide dehydrogenase small subunit
MKKQPDYGKLLLTEKGDIRMIVEFVLNNEAVNIDVDGNLKLHKVIREVLGLTGTKTGCEIGECGACSVLLDGKLVKSCLVPVNKAAGRKITTIEGISQKNGEPNDLQQSFLEHGATQCGYCTPGMILAAEALLLVNHSPTRFEIREAISENLCRCTGYQQIIDAIEMTAAKRNAAREKLGV